LTKAKVDKKEEVLMSEQEVYDVLKFAQSLGYNNAIITPFLLNSRLRDITLSNSAPDETTLNAAMADPKNNEIALLEFSQDFEQKSQSYKKLLSFYSNILSFDMTYDCTNGSYKDFKSKEYQGDLDIFKKFIDSFNYKEQFSSVVGELLRNEAAFYVKRIDDSSGKMVLQELPANPNWTLINGHSPYGLLFDFNMYWFIQPGIDLRGYPKFFSDKYKQLWDSGTFEKYTPFMPADIRNSSWVYWTQIPLDVGWMWKFDPTIATRIPKFAPLFLDLIQQPLMRALQKNINLAASKKMILGSVGILKDAQAKVKDQFNINPDTLGKFLAVVQAAVGDAVKVAAAPLDGLKGVEFSSENELYGKYLDTAISTSTGNVNLISNPLNVKRNIEEVRFSLNVDEQEMYALYPQFENFIDYHVNKLTKKYKFKTHFEGSQFYNNREQRLEKQMTLMGNGIVMPNKIAAALGMSPFEFQRNLDEARANGWVDNLTPVIAAAQMSGEKQKGRPSKSDSELSDSGLQTRENGGNLTKGGKR
jgi:hypothetical protein